MQRNATLTSLAGAMRRKGFGEAAIHAALLAENAERCHPPLPEAEIARIARSVSRYAPAVAGGSPRRASAGQDLRRVHRREGGRPMTAIDAPFTPLSLEAFFALELPEIEYVVEEILPAESACLLDGREKSGKGLLSLDLCASVALGRAVPRSRGQRGPGHLLRGGGASARRAVAGRSATRRSSRCSPIRPPA